MVFFTDTLELVFATSDRIEAGWDVKANRSGSRAKAFPLKLFIQHCSGSKNGWHLSSRHRLSIVSMQPGLLGDVRFFGMLFE